ncbi:MAG: hypothetical protein K2K89_05080 [Ruminococcus sp.]|nr:hypothetical protein [Ruminococcus sp.]
MKKFRKIIACLCALSVCVSMGSLSNRSINNVSAVSGYSAPTGENDRNLADFSEQVAEMVNQERTKQGLPSLTYNSALNKAASQRAIELIEYYSHDRPDGRSCGTIFGEYGISTMKYGENIAMYQETPEEVMEDWMGSTGHRANILNSTYTNIGVGVAYYNGNYYWVQTFTDDVEVSDDVTWYLDNDGTLTVNGTGYMPDKMSLFSLRSTVKKVIIGEDMKSMNCYGLATCENLSEVTVLNPNCQINNTEYPIKAGTIYGYSGSTAQTYAHNKNKSFVTIYSNPYQTPTTTTQTTTETTTTTTTTTTATTSTTTKNTQEKNRSTIYIKTVDENGQIINNLESEWSINGSERVTIWGTGWTNKFTNKDGETIYLGDVAEVPYLNYMKLPDGSYTFKNTFSEIYDSILRIPKTISFSVKDNVIKLSTTDKRCWVENDNTLVIAEPHIETETLYALSQYDHNLVTTFSEEEIPDSWWWNNNVQVVPASEKDKVAFLEYDHSLYVSPFEKNTSLQVAIMLANGNMKIFTIRILGSQTETTTTATTTMTTTTRPTTTIRTKTTTTPTTTTTTSTSTTAVGNYQQWTMFEDTIVSIGDDKVTFAERGNTAIMNNGYNMDKIKAAGVGSKVSVEAIVSPSGSILSIISIEVLEKSAVPTGDANGDGKVSVADAVLIMQSLSNPSEFTITKECADAADVINKGDGITSMDALAIQMIDINLLSIEDLPMTSEKLQELMK